MEIFSATYGSFLASQIQCIHWNFRFRYIIWTEQNFPMGTGIELKQLFERFIHHFHKNDRYANDERFVKIYLKYVSIMASRFFLLTFALENCIESVWIFSNLNLQCCSFVMKVFQAFALHEFKGWHEPRLLNTSLIVFGWFPV